jgi:hypothetical protein
MSEKPLATIHIKIQSRSDGTVYISSDDMPGLWLWGKDHDQVFRSIIPTIEELYRLNEGQAVKAREAPPSRFARWFAQEKINDKYEIYPVAQLNEQTVHGR